MDVHWNQGSEDCVKNPQPPIQVHQYNAQTFILRESLCATYEAPFIYLLIGKTKALLIDTGAVADAKTMPLAQTVISLLPKGGSRLPLMVVHTHGHLDHRSGDDQFRALPDVEVVPTDLESVKNRLGIADWPNGTGLVDLGDRVIDVIPTPGHYSSHVAYYDRQSGLFFSGDFFLPGRLLLKIPTRTWRARSVLLSSSSSIQSLMCLAGISSWTSPVRPSPPADIIRMSGRCN